MDQRNRDMQYISYAPKTWQADIRKSYFAGH